ncbi:MAG: thiamine-phosphate kinase [Woeseia sp.]
MDEFELIRRFFRTGEQAAGVSVGIGDDGAVVTPAAQRDLVVVVDTLVEGVHYPEQTPAEHIGFRALAVNLSDIAAMAAKPRWMTLALTLSEAREEWLTNFSAGLFAAARLHGVSLIGGDTTRGDQTVISVQVIGEVHPGTALTRAGAGAGDAIFISGTVGDAAGGLSLLQQKSGPNRASDTDAALLSLRFYRPTARVDLGLAIGGIATAAIDLSDGLGTDLDKLLQASGVAATIERERLPLSESLMRTFGQEQALAFAMDGGDDYELCFTVTAADTKRVEVIAQRLDLPLTRIGEIEAGSGLTIKNGQRRPWQGGGYRHF